MQKRITKVDNIEMGKFLPKFQMLSLAPGDKVWVRNLPWESKLDRIWQSPCEVEKVISSSRVVVNTAQGDQILWPSRLKPYLNPYGAPASAHCFNYFSKGDVAPAVV